jgi:hypothetical protein
MGEKVNYYYECDCGSEIVRVAVDREYPDEIYLSFYESPGIPGLWWKLRQAWQIIRYGRPYEDMVWLSFKDAERLANNLMKLVKEWKLKD